MYAVRRVLAPALAACLLLVGALVYPLAVPHAAHHAHHHAATHSTALCAWLCAAGQALHAAEPILSGLPALAPPRAAAGDRSTPLLPPFLLPSRAPPVV
ncbi:hypothetical protein [Candidatus Nitrospira bockiana]